MEYIIAADRTLFCLLNGVWTSGILDIVMPVVTDAKLWAPLLIGLWLWLLFGGGGRRRALALLLVVATGATDQLSSAVVKKMVARKRPCCSETDARLLVPCKSSKSFPSSHASNTAAAAAVVWLEAGPVAGVAMAFLSFVVGYSRVYIGVHYPFDVAAGWLLGFAVAWTVVMIRRRFWPASRAGNGRPGPPASDGLPLQ